MFVLIVPYRLRRTADWFRSALVILLSSALFAINVEFALGQTPSPKTIPSPSVCVATNWQVKLERLSRQATGAVSSDCKRPASLTTVRWLPGLFPCRHVDGGSRPGSPDDATSRTQLSHLCRRQTGFRVLSSMILELRDILSGPRTAHHDLTQMHVDSGLVEVRLYIIDVNGTRSLQAVSNAGR